jgi:hypothetical protein
MEYYRKTLRELVGLKLINYDYLSRQFSIYPKGLLDFLKEKERLINLLLPVVENYKAEEQIINTETKPIEIEKPKEIVNDPIIEEVKPQLNEEPKEVIVNEPEVKLVETLKEAEALPTEQIINEVPKHKRKAKDKKKAKKHRQKIPDVDEGVEELPKDDIKLATNEHIIIDEATIKEPDEAITKEDKDERHNRYVYIR